MKLTAMHRWAIDQDQAKEDRVHEVIDVLLFTTDICEGYQQELAGEGVASKKE
jgi:hypothetical protein